MKKIIFCLSGFIFFSSVIFPQNNAKKIYHPFMGSLCVTLSGGVNSGFTDYKTSELGYITGGDLEYFFNTYSNHSFGIRVFSGIGSIGGRDSRNYLPDFKTNLSSLGIGITYGYFFDKKFFPYLSVGFSNLWFDPKDTGGNRLPNNRQGNYKLTAANINLEFGWRLVLGSRFSLVVSGAINLHQNDWLDDFIAGGSNDLFVTGSIGFSYSLFAEKDSDEDGVPDSKDECRGTGLNIPVDEKGCPLDSDFDGVPDYKDKCPNTPYGFVVDANGCPRDSDKDGVIDNYDRCPDTPLNVLVNRFGCPLDSDGDGVPDYLDKCPGTPPNTPVNNYGCPEDGGHIQFINQEVVLSVNTNFETGKTIISPNGYRKLDTLIQTLKAYPDTKWRIDGHTDSVGTYLRNLELSFERANSVLSYIISKGIDVNRFEVYGLGEEFPVSENRTEEGRAKNRRVVISRIK